MSDDGANRPKRAFSPLEDGDDNTPPVEPYRPRRGGAADGGYAASPLPETPESTFIPPPTRTYGARFSDASPPDSHVSTARRSAASALSPTEPLVLSPDEPVRPARAAEPAAEQLDPRFTRFLSGSSPRRTSPTAVQQSAPVEQVQRSTPEPKDQPFARPDDRYSRPTAPTQPETDSETTTTWSPAARTAALTSTGGQQSKARALSTEDRATDQMNQAEENHSGSGNPSIRPDRGSETTPGSKDWRKLLIAAAVTSGVVILVVVLWASGLIPTQQSTPSPLDPAASVAAATLTDDQLLTPAEVAGAGGVQTWFVAQTLGELSSTSTPPACLTAVTGTIKPAASRQRTLTADQNPELAVLHQLDNYSSPADAGTVFEQRAAKLASCDDSPAHIVSSSTVTGIGDAALQITITYQAAKTHNHTVLMVRTGSLISIVDLASDSSNIPAEEAVRVVTPALTRACSIAGGACPAQPAAAQGAPPTAPPAGWLIPADLPRMTADTGRWTGTEPFALNSTGTGCENLTLSTIAGPTDRKQRTYLLTQDPNAPQKFGADEMLFTFSDPAAATAFAKTLSDNIRSCAQRLATAEVAPGAAIQATVGQAAVDGTTFTITQSLSQENKVIFQVALVTTGTKVSYFLVNTTEGFKFSPEQFTAIATRAGERATQLP